MKRKAKRCEYCKKYYLEPCLNLKDRQGCPNYEFMVKSAKAGPKAKVKGKVK